MQSGAIMLILTNILARNQLLKKKKTLHKIFHHQNPCAFTKVGEISKINMISVHFLRSKIFLKSDNAKSYLLIKRNNFRHNILERKTSQV